MALEISEYRTIGYIEGQQAQIAGQPTAVHPAGDIVLDDETRLFRIYGSGTLAWPNGVTETFDSVEFRSVDGGITLTAT